MLKKQVPIDPSLISSNQDNNDSNLKHISQSANSWMKDLLFVKNKNMQIMTITITNKQIQKG
jgi:hypothetical protein